MRPGKLEALHALVRLVEDEGVPGLFLEAGVAMGGSASVIAASKARSRHLWLYDAFALPPPPGPRDDDRSHQAYGDFLAGRTINATEENYQLHRADLLGWARENLRRVGVDPDGENIRFVAGLYEETLHVDEPVAFAHIDCDWYESVRLCIDRVAPWVSPGGVLLFDDYGAYEGAARAVDEWLAQTTDVEVVHDSRSLGVRRCR